MADGALGARDIEIDLTIATARVIKDAVRTVGEGVASPEIVYITGIEIQGVTGGAAGTIVLRRDSASGGVVFRQLAAAASTIDTNVQWTDPIPCRGLYMDAMSGAWSAGARMIIHTR